MRRVDTRQVTLDLRRPGLTAGVDEAGRGPLAGPVVAAAVILDRRHPIRGIADSKVLTPAVREELSSRIRARCVAWGLGWADATEIDALNILQATLLAMRRAVEALSVLPIEALVGYVCPLTTCAAAVCATSAQTANTPDVRSILGGALVGQHRLYLKDDPVLQV